MLGMGGVLDVVIGLCFMYLMLSLVCSGINELISWVLSLRANTLYAGIQTLPAEPTLRKATGAPSHASLHEALYAHPLIRSLSPQGLLSRLLRNRAKPSYIPSQSVVLALLDTIGEQTIDPRHVAAGIDAVIAELNRANVDIPSDLTDTLRSLRAEGSQAVRGVAAQALGDRLLHTVQALPSSPPRDTLLTLLQQHQTLDGVRLLIANMPDGSALKRQLRLLVDDQVTTVREFRKRMEVWFDSSMDRVSGVYKRRMQLVSLFVGLVVAVGGGVDTVVVGDALYRNPQLRDSLVAHATQSVQKEQPSPQLTTSSPPQVNGSLERISQAAGALDGLPIGLRYLSQQRSKIDPSLSDGGLQYWLLRTLGMLFTALALSFGAPFWFDLLSKLINIRTAGPRPERGAKG